MSSGGTLAVLTLVKPSLRNGLWHLTNWMARGVAETLRQLRRPEGCPIWGDGDNFTFIGWAACYGRAFAPHRCTFSVA